jgi:glutamine amidotransferase
MCELLAMSCLHPARLTTSLTALASHAQGASRRRDGWGAAYYQGHDVALYRDTKPADTSAQVRWLEENGPTTTLAISYIRHATQGEIALANTGPFVRELDGRMHVFAHNGNLKDLARYHPRMTGRFEPVGETDSEFAFCLLLDRIGQLEHAPRQWPPLQLRMEAVAAVAVELRTFGPASFLYADGDALFAHADRRLQPLTGQVAAPALYRLECPAENSSTLLRDCLLPDSTTVQRMILLASVPLTDESWKPMPEGEVIAVRHGEIVAALPI